MSVADLKCIRDINAENLGVYHAENTAKHALYLVAEMVANEKFLDDIRIFEDHPECASRTKCVFYEADIVVETVNTLAYIKSSDVGPAYLHIYSVTEA